MMLIERNKEAFVYCWTNLTNGKKYVGYHKGDVDDGYICSSKSNLFWQDWKSCDWSRQIIAFGSCEECVKLEYSILNKLDLTSDEWYNNSKGGGIIFTEEVKSKMSRTFSDEHKKKLSEAAKKRKRTPEHIQKLHDGRRNSKNSEEHKEILRNNWLGKKHSEKAKKKMSEAKLNDPENHERMKRAAKISAENRQNNPEYSKKHSERMKQWWAERKKKLNVE